MPKITDAHRESRRDQILDAALACFAERGFQATSMADIIAASGTTCLLVSHDQADLKAVCGRILLP